MYRNASMGRRRRKRSRLVSLEGEQLGGGPAQIRCHHPAACGARRRPGVYFKSFLQNVNRQRLAVSANGVELGFFPFHDRKPMDLDGGEVWIPFTASALASRPLRISFA